MLGLTSSPVPIRSVFRARAATGLAVAVVAATVSVVSTGTAATAANPAPASAGPCVTRTYVVPQGVTRLSIRAIGAAGAQGRASDLHGGGAGGLGAEVTNGPVEVTPGQTLYVGVATPSLAGGVGGNLYYSNGVLVSGARGGNGSLVTTAAPDPVDCSFDPTTMLIAAAGGGGGGHADLGGPGGTGGGAGAAGNPGGNNQDSSGGGGGAGTESAPGAGGAAGYVYDHALVCPTCKHRSTGVGGNGKKYGTGIGADRMGGIGGAGGSNDNDGAAYEGTSGGGGGGGVFGGGGGGGSGAGFSGQGTGAGGGGGGSSYPASAARLTTEAPSVTFTPSYDTRTTLTSSVNPAQPGESVTLRANVESVNVDGTGGLTDGTVTFRDLGPTIESGESGVLLGSAAPVRNANGGASSALTVSNLSGGRHNITVRFGGTFPTGGAGEPPQLRASTDSLAQVVVSPQTVAFTSTPGARAAYGATYRPTVSSTSGLPVTIGVDASAANVCFIDPATAPVVSFRAEGTCVLNADQAGSSEFFAAPRVQQSFPVAFGTAPQQQVITFTSTPPSELVAGTVYEFSAVGGGSGNPVTFQANSVFGSCFQAGPNKVEISAGGYCTIIASQAGGPGFNGAEARQELYIPPFPQSIYFRTQPPATMAVGDVYDLQASVSTRRLATFGTGAGSSACTVVRVPPTPFGNEISYATVTATRTGPCVVTAQETTSDIYRTPSPLIQQSFLIGSPQTVEFTSTAPSDGTVGGTYSPVTRSATPNGAQPVVLTSATPSTCSVSGSVVSFVGAGTCTLRADQDGTDVYAPAPRATQSFTIARADQVVEFLSAAPDPMVDDTYEPRVSGGASSKPVVITSGTSDTCEISDGVVTFIGAGPCALVADQAADANYTAAISVVQLVTVRGFAQEIKVTSDAPTDAVVGDMYTPSATGGASGQPVMTGVRTPQVCSAADGVVSFMGAGSCVVVFSQAGTSRYAAAPDVTQTVQVGKATQTVAFTTVAPDDAAVDGTYTPTVTGGGSSKPVVVGTSTPSLCSVADGVVTFTATGDCTITADQAGDADYTAAPQVEQTIGVRALAQEIVVTSDAPTDAVVGDDYTPTATGGASGQPVVTAVSTPQVCSVDDALVSFTGAGPCVVVISQAGTSRYAAAPDVTQTVEVGKASQTLAFTSSAPDDAAVDGTYTPTVTGGESSSPIVINSSTPDNCVVADGVVTFTDSGDCTITVDQAGDADYTAAPPVEQTIGVRALAQEIVVTSDAPTDAVVGDDYTPTATGGASGQPVVTAVSTPQVCSVDDALVSFTGAGSCVVVFSQAGTSRYAAAPDVTQTVQVGKATQTVAFTTVAPDDAAVDGTYTPTVTGGDSSSPVVIGTSTPDTCDVSAGVVTFTGAGDCTITADQAGDADYTAAPQVEQTIAVRALAQEIVVTSDAPTDAVVGDDYTPTATGGASGQPVVTAVSTPQVCSVDDALVSFTGAGPCVVVISQAGTSRYAAAPDVTQTVEVGKASQTLAFTSSAPDAPAVDGTYTPTVTGGESSSPIVINSSTPDNCVVADGVVTFTDSGDCTITADQDADANYTAAPQVVQTIRVRALAQEIKVTSDAPTDAVVGDTYTPSVTGGASGQPVVTGVRTPQVCSAADGVVSFMGAGSCVVVFSQAGTSRYAAAPDVTQTVQVGKATQTVKFLSAAPDAEVDDTYQPRVSGGGSSKPVVVGSSTPDTCDVSDGVVTFTATGDCTITADQAADANYTAAPQVAQTIAVRSAVDPELPEVCAAVVSVGSAPPVKEPGTGTIDLVFPLAVTDPHGCGDLSVSATVSGGTAVAGSDFTVPSSPVVLPAGATTGEIRIPVLADLDVEPDETVVLALSGVTGAGNPTLGAASGTGKITDDDAETVKSDPAVVPDAVTPSAGVVHIDVVVESLAACRIGAPVPAGYVQVKGTPGPDRLRGSARNEIFFGGAGDDRIEGGGGNDIICGRGGDDILIGGTGNDRLSGGFGLDGIFGGSGNDQLLGAVGDDRLVGGSGDDELAGQSGDDRLLGGTGDDRLAGGPGTDMLSGGQGIDVLDHGRD